MRVKRVLKKGWQFEKGEPIKAIESVSHFQTLKPGTITRADLPELITSKEAAQMLRCHVKTIETWRKSRRIGFLRIGRLYFTTPEFIASFLESELRKNG